MKKISIIGYGRFGKILATILNEFEIYSSFLAFFSFYINILFIHLAIYKDINPKGFLYLLYIFLPKMRFAFYTFYIFYIYFYIYPYKP